MRIQFRNKQVGAAWMGVTNIINVEIIIIIGKRYSRVINNDIFKSRL